MLPDRVSNPGPLTYESGALPIALRGPALTSGSVKVRVDMYSSTSMARTNSFLSPWGKYRKSRHYYILDNLW